jgi:hypothetical protein
MAREAGAALSIVESIVGHSSASMTQHYTHTSELAASSAIGLLPNVTSDTATPPKPTGRTWRELLRETIESMTTKNVREKKAAALALLAQAVN